MLQLKKILHNKKSANDDGLTMLELLTAIAVLGIVTAIASPVIISMIQQAQIDAYKGEMSYISDSTYKMINGTFGQPTLANAQITSDGEVISLESLGPSVDVETLATIATTTNGYWYDIGTMSVPFDAQEPNATIVWENSRVVRVVPVQENGSFITDPNNQVIDDACITAWIGDRNLVVESVKSSNVTEDNSTPCGLIPGPIEEPEAPSAPQSLEPSGDGETSGLTASLIAPPDNLGADSEDISIESYRVTCTDLTNGGTSVATSATNTVDGFSPELTRGADYSCTAAITTNAYPGFSPESAQSATIRIPEAPGMPTGLAAEVGEGGVLNLNWEPPANDGCNESGIDEGNYCGNNFKQIDYELQYMLKTDGTELSGLTDADFVNANTLPLNNYPGDPVSFILSNTSIQEHNNISADSLDELENGNTYFLRVRATNQVNAVPEKLEGAWSGEIEQQAGDKPDAINDATGDDGANQVSVDFTIPYNGGLPIVNIEIWYDINNTYDGGGVTYEGPDGDYTPLGHYDICTEDDPATGNPRTDPCNLELQGSVDSKASLSDPGITSGDPTPAYICDKGLLVWNSGSSEWIGNCNDANLVLGQLPDSTSYFFKIFTENAIGMADWSNQVAVATLAPADAPDSTDANIDGDGNATVEWR